jgi:amino acid adenylation domain-containing protein
MSTRPREMERAIGLFVNEAPLLSRPRRSAAFADLLAEVAAGVAALSRVRQFPFNEALARFGPARDPQALMPRTGISYRRTEGREPEARGVRFAPDRQSPVYGRRWDVRFRFLDRPGGIDVGLEYDTAVLHPAGARRLAAHLRALLGEVVRAPDARLDRLGVPSRPARRRPAPRVLPTVPRLFEAQVERRGDAEAIVAGEQRYSYCELNRRAEEIAGRLGDRRRVIVAVCLERSVDLVASLLAVSRCGAAFLPLDPRYPAERLAFMLRDSRAALLLTQRSLLDRLGGLGPVMCVDETGARTTAPFTQPTPDDLAYVIYTSGSTGRPKGVEIPHGALSNLVMSAARTPGLGPADTQVAVASVSFDLAVLELLGPLTAGARLVVAPADAASDGPALAALLRAHAATFLHATPATWRMLVAAGWHGLATAVSGAEPLTGELARELLSRAGAVWNSYGPTETTVASTYARIRDPDRISIGRAIAGTSVHVLDRARRPVPRGVPGELHIGGAGVARGYLGRPELTREAFVTHGDDRLYGSGDLVRERDDLALEYLRRLDGQLKIRGFRIEPGEVEAALADDPGVRQALVTAWEDANGDTRLVAYLTTTGGAAPSATDLRNRLAHRLPDHMIPNLFVPLDRFPVTAGGKVDRRRLPDPAAVEREPTRAPRTVTEAALAAIWTAVLGLDAVGVDDDFFALGGHSLLAAEVAARAAESLGEPVPVAIVFRHPTVAAMASALDARAGVASLINRSTPAGRA